MSMDIDAPVSVSTSGCVGSLQTTTTKPEIVILAIDEPEYFIECYADFIDELKSFATVKLVTTAKAAKEVFAQDDTTDTSDQQQPLPQPQPQSQPHSPGQSRSQIQAQPKIIFAADSTLCNGAHGSSLITSAVKFVRISGGTLIFMGLFPSNTPPPSLAKMFTQFGLGWRAGAYSRGTFSLNANFHGEKLDTIGLEERYNLKAMHVANVERDDAVYLATTADSHGESAVIGEAAGRQVPVDHTRPRHTLQTPIAFAKVGEGKVGYVGDVNDEDGTRKVLFKMAVLPLLF